MNTRPNVFGSVLEELQQPQEEPTAKAFTEVPERSIIKTSTYLPNAVYDTLRDIAHAERVKFHDLIIEGIEAVLKRRNYPRFDELKKGK